MGIIIPHCGCKGCQKNEQHDSSYDTIKENLLLHSELSELVKSYNKFKKTFTASEWDNFFNKRIFYIKNEINYRKCNPLEAAIAIGELLERANPDTNLDDEKRNLLYVAIEMIIKS